MARRAIPLITLLLLAVLLPAGATAVFVPTDSTAAHHPTVALVLGGGGAKGAAHVGALKVIEEAGIRPDIIVGTSIGAIVGGLYSRGYSAARLDTLFRSQQWLQLFTREAIRGNAIKTMLDSLAVGERNADFACVAADLNTLTEVILSDDSLARNMRASMAIPGVFRPVKFDDYLLLDGGLLNNLPVDVARQMGADVVIAVDLTVNHHDKEERKGKKGEGAEGDSDFSWDDIFDLSKVKGVLGWLINRPDFKKYKKNCQEADVLINPPLNGYAATSFARQSIESMIAIGEAAAREQLGELRRVAKAASYTAVTTSQPM